MYNHEPKDYVCPFCLIVRGQEDGPVFTRQDDIVYRDEQVIAFVASHWWINNPGHVLVMPTAHIENIYDLPDELSAKIHAVSKQVALAFKETYPCQGVSTRQHNERAGSQDVWHYHLNVFPRYENDNLYLTYDKNRLASPEERLPYAEKLRAYFANLLQG